MIYKKMESGMWIADIDALRLDFKWWRIVDSPAAHRITIPVKYKVHPVRDGSALIDNQKSHWNLFFVETLEQSIDIPVYHYNQVMYNIKSSKSLPLCIKSYSPEQICILLILLYANSLIIPRWHIYEWKHYLP